MNVLKVLFTCFKGMYVILLDTINKANTKLSKCNNT